MRHHGGLVAFALAVAGPLLAQEPPKAPRPAAAPDRPAPAPEDDPTVSTPPVTAAPAAGRARSKPGIVPGKPVTVTRGAASTVTVYEKGKALTVKTPAGTLVRYRLARNTSVPPDLASGRAVLVETRVVKKRLYASRVTYAESRLVMTNVD